MKRACRYRSPGIFRGLIFGALLLTSVTTLSQSFVFRGQIFNEQVSLFWLADTWPQSMDGVIIRSQNPNRSVWEDITPIIKPSAEEGKDLSVLVPPELLEAVADTFKSYVNRETLKYISADDYYTDVLSNEVMLSSVGLMFRLDHYLAVYSGFGLITNTKKQRTFGLFRVFDGVPEASPHRTITVTEPSRLQISQEVNKTAERNQYEVKWLYSPAEVEQENYKGFDVLLRDNGLWKRINEKVIHNLQSGESAAVTQRVQVAQDSSVRMALRPVSYFHVESPIYEVNIAPGEESEFLLQGALNGNSIQLSWSDEELSNMELTVSFEGETESIKVKGTSYEFTPPETGQYLFRLEGFKSGRLISSPIVTINYAKTLELPKPTVQAELIDNEQERYILLEYGASGLQKAKLFVAFRPEEQLSWDTSIKDFSGGFVEYPVVRKIGSELRFAIEVETEGQKLRSNEVTVVVPSVFVPQVGRVTVEKSSEAVNLSWTYENKIPDLAGFRIFVNDELVADEEVLDAESRYFGYSPQSAGTYSAQILAVSNTGVQSKMSPAIGFRWE